MSLILLMHLKCNTLTVFDECDLIYMRALDPEIE